MSELCLTSAVPDWTRNRLRERWLLWVGPRFKTVDPRPVIPQQVEAQFIASQPFPVLVSGITPSPSAVPGPMLVCQMPTPGHGNLDSYRISTPIRLPDVWITRPTMDHSGWSFVAWLRC